VLELLGMILQPLWDAHEQGLQAFRHGRMREHGIPQTHVWQACQHGQLNRTHEFAIRPKGREPENAVAVLVDERFHEPTSFGQGPGPPGGVDRDG